MDKQRRSENIVPDEIRMRFEPEVLRRATRNIKTEEYTYRTLNTEDQLDF